MRDLTAGTLCRENPGLEGTNGGAVADMEALLWGKGREAALPASRYQLVNSLLPVLG